MRRNVPGGGHDPDAGPVGRQRRLTSLLRRSKEGRAIPCEFPHAPAGRAHAPFARSSDRGLTHVRLTGELDILTLPALKEALGRPTAGWSLIVLIDMRTVTFLDLTATRLLLDAHLAVAREGGRMVLVRGEVAFDWWLPRLGLADELEIVGVRARPGTG